MAGWLPNRGDVRHVRKWIDVADNVAAARCFILDAIVNMWRTVCGGDEPSLEQRARLSLASNQAMGASVDAVDRVFRLAGACAVMADEPLQRCFRDIHTAYQHLFWRDGRDQAVASLRFGIDDPSFVY